MTADAVDFRLLGALEVDRERRCRRPRPAEAAGPAGDPAPARRRDRAGRSAHRPAVGRAPPAHRRALDPDLRLGPSQGRSNRSAATGSLPRARPATSLTRPPTTIDARRFERLVEEGTRQLRDGDRDGGARDAPDGASAVARAGVVGLRLRGVRPALHPSVQRPAPRRDRGACRCRARGRARRARSSRCSMPRSARIRSASGRASC